MEEENCPVCGISEGVKISHNGWIVSINCPCCGSFVISSLSSFKSPIKDKNKFSAYLYYHSQKFIPEDSKGWDHYNLLGSKEFFDNVNIPNCTFITDEMVENWYPKTFSEKIDMILLGFAKQSKHYGDAVVLSEVENQRAFFIDHLDIKEEVGEGSGLQRQIDFISLYLYANYVEAGGFYTYTLTSKGWVRVDELQKNQTETSKTVFVAMSFASEMKGVRECIRNAIVDTGYEAIFIDEKQHNKQIVPEMLYQIRQAKFLVAELTGHNNGAYFEAGYALGLGKEVIQVCSKKSFGADGHFDVKQVSTILWEKESEITEKLAKRIEATIGSLKGVE